MRINIRLVSFLATDCHYLEIVAGLVDFTRKNQNMRNGAKIAEI